MVRNIVLSSALALTVGMSALSGSAQAQSAPCGGNFDRWLNQVRSEAGKMGISPRVISSALNGLTPDARVLSRDRKQGVFNLTFLKFTNRLISKNRMDRGRQLIKKHSATFKRVRKEFGVPASVLTAFWGLETDFGGFMGDFNTMRSLVTLAHDCRRPELFRPQVFDAMRLVERGDLSLSQMVGAWAGELGQTQFLPSDYLRVAVDYDRNGRVDLIGSVPDVLGSTAKLIRSHGWRAGEPWLQEVRVPRSMAWDQADIAIKHSRAQWAKWGVTRADGGRLKADQLKASLLLPMGKNGPAFLAYHNFTHVYLEWNQSLIYATTAGYFATRLAGAPPVRQGNGTVIPLSSDQMKQLQHALARRGFDVGKIDGILGAGTRAGVKAMQKKYGFPADSYPTEALLQKLR